MSRFDDELRSAADPLAREPLPDGVLDEALDAAPVGPRWPGVVGVVVAALLVVVVAGIGIGQVVPTPSPEPSPTAPSPGACPEVPAPAAGEDIVSVFFPCGNGSEMASGTRPVDPSLDTPSAVVFFTLQQLLIGPTPAEEASGMRGIVPRDSEELVVGVIVQPDGLAQIDFDPALRDVNNLTTTAAGGQFLASVRETALQFDDVTAVELQIGGSCDEFFADFGSTCQHFAEPVEEISDCPIIPPAELPSGALITEPRPYPNEPAVSWGSEADTVTQMPGHRSGGPELPRGGEPVTVRGYEGVVVEAENQPEQQILIGWEEDGCPYFVWIGPPITLGEAVDYAARYGPVVAQPPPTATPQPGQPVTATVEDQGIRLTLTLDRDRIEFEQRVWADVTVENIGADIVYWGHSGTCVWAASVVAYVDGSETPPYGREDWPGEDGVLKDVTVNSRIVPGYGFTSEEAVDFEGTFACTSDLRITEVMPGDVLTYRAAWDGDAAHGQPATPGSYRTEATFNYMSRGAPPTDEDAPDEHAVVVSVLLTVDGPNVDYLSPGEAVDRVLEDASFQQLFDDAPRARWQQSDLTWQGGTWDLVLYLDDPIEAIVATVDAISGEVLSVELGQYPRPPGS